MKFIKRGIITLLLTAVCTTAFAFDSGDQVFYLHGPHNSALNISKARVVSSNGSQILVRSERTGQQMRFSSTSLHGSWQDANVRKQELDAAHFSKAEVAGGLGVLVIYGLCKAIGEC